MYNRKPPKILIVFTALGTLASIAAIILGVMSMTSHPKTTHVAQQAPHSVQFPATAEEISNQLGGTSFKDLGPAPQAGVVDSGSFMKDGKKYAVNTFASQSVRDSWLQAAENLGVVPKWETDTSVVYLSVSNSPNY